MLRHFRFYLIALGAVLLAGCCANTACDCQDSRADALYFRFLVDDTATNPQAFLSSEVDTVWLLRFPLDTAARPRRDSLSLIRTGARATDPIVLDNNAPFPAGSRKLHAFRYDLLFRDRSRALRRYEVRNIGLKGDFEGQGCCTCYVNSHKSAQVNGQTYTVTETNREPVAITLSR